MPYRGTGSLAVDSSQSRSVWATDVNTMLHTIFRITHQIKLPSINRRPTAQKTPRRTRRIIAPNAAVVKALLPNQLRNTWDVEARQIRAFEP